MNKFTSAVLVAAASTALASSASAALIAGFNFNNLSIATASNPGSGGVPTSINASSGSGVVSLTGWGGTVDDFGGTTVNAVSGDVAGVSLSLIGGGTSAGPFPGNGTFITVAVDLTGHENPILSFATQKTTTGFGNNQLAYSTDGGASFTDFGAAYNPASSYAVQSFDLSTVDALDNQANVVFRLTLSGATSNSGNNRIDNLQVNATLVPEPMAMSALAGMGLLALRRRRA